jgi:hypothetical protein
MPSGPDPKGGNRFSEKNMLRQRGEIAGRTRLTLRCKKVRRIEVFRADEFFAGRGASPAAAGRHIRDGRRGYRVHVKA